MRARVTPTFPNLLQMKQVLYLSVFLIALATRLCAQEASSPLLSPATRLFLTHGPEPLPEGYVYKTGPGGERLMSALVQVVNAGAAERSLNAIGATIGTQAGAVWTLQVPVIAVPALAKAAGIRYVQLDEPLAAPRLSSARRATRVDSVHGGYDLPMAYSGKGVIVGIIDFGFDYGNPLFYDTLGAKYRVRKVWELGGSGAPPAPYTYGRELGDTTSIQGATTDNAKQTHGTAVAGMAIGSGWGSTNNRIWRGMAYDAEAVLVGVRRDSIAGQWRQSGFADFIDGVNYIFKYAQSVGKPAVVNISWGSQSGPHDGTTLFNQACDALSGAGKIIVMSAGNEGTEHIHMGKTFTAVDSQLATFLTFSPKKYQRTWVDAWGDTGKTWCAEATLYRNGAPSSATISYCLDNGAHPSSISGTGGALCTLNFINSTAEFNGKPRMTIEVLNKTTDTLRIAFRAKSGKLNVWNEYYYYGYDSGYQSSFAKLGYPDATEGDSMMCTSDMGAAQSVLLVGASVTRNAWTDINNNMWSYNSSYAPLNGLAAFSSRGPMADGRIKPDICAPGLTITSTMSSYDTAYTPTGQSSAYVRTKTTFKGRDYYFGEFSGTSAASPAAAGIVALMLQAKPSLTPAECKSVIFQTAIQDNFTGALPSSGNNAWGHGKINAYGAVKALVAQLGVPQYSGSRKLDCTLFPNPAEGAFTLHFEGDRSESLSVEIYNAVGSLMRQQIWNVKGGLNVLPVSAAGLSTGNYLVHVAGNDGAVNIKAVLR